MRGSTRRVSSARPPMSACTLVIQLGSIPMSSATHVKLSPQLVSIPGPRVRGFACALIASNSIRNYTLKHRSADQLRTTASLRRGPLPAQGWGMEYGVWDRARGRTAGEAFLSCVAWKYLSSPQRASHSSALGRVTRVRPENSFVFYRAHVECCPRRTMYVATCSCFVS